MNIYRMLVIVGMVLVQVSGANAQFGGLGNLIKNELNKPANPPPKADSNATITNSPTTDQSKTTSDSAGANSANSVNASPSGLPPIFEAAQNCDVDKFTELFKKDISTVNKTLYDSMVDDSRYSNPYKNYTLLAFAAASGCTNIIQQLLDMDAEVNPELVSPLGEAAANGHMDAVKMLLKANANPQQAMAAAVKNGQVEVLKTLIDAGASGGEGLLKEPVANGQLEIVQILLKLKKDPSETDEYGYTRREVFRNAIEKGNLDIVKAFVVADEEVSDERDNDDRANMRDTLTQVAINANQADILAYLKETKKAQATELAEKKAAIAKEEADKQEKETAAKNQAVQKQVLDLLDHPTDLFGMANSRYRKFNGTVYDCAEPIEFLNRLYAFLPVEGQYNDNPDSLKEIKDRVEAESKWVHDNPWYKIQNDCSLSPVLVKQVTPDGLIVQLNSQQDEEILVLLKNHPKQKTAVDGDAIIGQLFVIKTSPYQYTDALGAIRTIPSYDMGAIVPTPSGSVPKVPLPEAAP
jgi:ankyrin repeat protein